MNENKETAEREPRREMLAATLSATGDALFSSACASALFLVLL